ncbi:hypothetical protein H4R34_000498 [Dimargaris verticillata]|uniref:Uncharacterized protein n=1 Tax=Dimargaris verticillata TaxID=2761393 RepID=A0A9W8BD51_9FUNG|nr:hypothetical protein H4R34_000498 [Dimargaris verticillata]
MGKSAKAFKRPTRKEKELKRTLTRSTAATDSRVTKSSTKESTKSQATGALKRDLQASHLEPTDPLSLATATTAAATRKPNGPGQRRFAKDKKGSSASKASASDYVDLYLGRKSTKLPGTLFTTEGS